MVAQGLREGGGLGGELVAAEIMHTISEGKLTCHERRVGRESYGHRRVGVSEPDTVPRKLIDMGSLDGGVAVATQMVCTQSIDCYDDHMERGRGRCASKTQQEESEADGPDCSEQGVHSNLGLALPFRGKGLRLASPRA